MVSAADPFAAFSRLAEVGRQWHDDAWAYAVDAAQRQLITLDVLRQRGNIFVEHEAAGMPPVLDFAHEMVVDGRTLERPVNYSLLCVQPPAAVRVDAAKRPFMIVDPRAGHGAGIGGFKADSQVGEAFEDGHPVYFVSFRPVPEAGQTLADVRDAEVHFLRVIAKRHPRAPKPAVVGNCQGGWATMLLAASAPDAIGPVVINGAPMSYWAGRVGHNPMRYLGGLNGGALPALLLADLGHGVFDGALLVANFEKLNPANSLFKKHYNLYANIDTEAERFLEFERWWGGFFLMNEAEIRWIVENLFIGNRLARGEARLGDESIDLRRVRTPIIVFASHGDNITPPQQALNWIADLYASSDEIRARGQRIVYMVHESVGHLGIFVSAQVAGREHDAITDTLRAIDALPPGLYEMRLDDEAKRVRIRFEPREIEDILALDDGRQDEEMFAAVAEMSELACSAYEKLARPWVRAGSSDAGAQAMRRMQPQRASRVLLSDRNPMVAPLAGWAESARQDRRPVAADNPFMVWERATAQVIESQLNLYRDWRDAGMEFSFHALWGQPALRSIGQARLAQGQQARQQDLRSLPAVQQALQGMAEGGAAEGMVRMLCLLARERGHVRRSRLERQLRVFAEAPVFAAFDAEALAALIHRQSLIADFEPEQALASLPALLDTEAERRDALDLVLQVAGPLQDMHPAARKTWDRFVQVLADAPVSPAAPVAPAVRAMEPEAGAGLRQRTRAASRRKTPWVEQARALVVRK